ncbi:MAG: 4-carboxymuconolactone decarboxylase domain/alkylhydroperoxidase AhpD family core domain protein [Rhodanobacteraceae bacterium]|jgi:AhpD family alkylhydroperoxidase|nr:MAG: 4-carboxymuconolactone decarboxylase domain/alkylhydroperoxidase AhpD family core domain protein [Rhodanobacteraceae bacterium]
MTQRIDYRKASPDGFKAMLSMQAHVDNCGIEHSLLELVKMRASQINGCAYCLDMHSKDARAAGETEQRLYLLDAWRESPFYSERERAALAWTEALTRISKTRDVPDALYDEARKQFSEKELVDLSLAIITINGWNRLAIPFRSEPGHYQPGQHAKGK